MTVQAKVSTHGTDLGTSANAGPFGSAATVVAPVSALAYVVVTSVTDPVFVADTPDMAVSALGRIIGQYCNYLEPGHLLWRPSGAVMLDAFDTAQAGQQTDTVLRTSQVQLGWLAWVAGLITIVACATWLQRRIGNMAATFFGVAVVLLSKAFINYAQVGASYMPALALLMVAVLLLSEEDGTPVRSIAAGACLGLSVLYWGTFVVALPAALAAPMIFGRNARDGFRNTVWAGLGGVTVAIISAVWVARSLGMDSASDLAAWAGTADHGIATGGLPRAVLGFARSYVETGDYGRIVKRFLLADPADPVPMRALFGFPMLGILGFYGGMLFMLVLAFRHRDRNRLLAFFACNALAVAAFAIFWQGGDLERYLPLVPGVALLAATAFSAGTLASRRVLVLLVVLMVIPNALTLGVPAVRAERDRLRSTTRDFETPDRPMLVFSHWQDERVQFYRNYPPGAAPLSYRPYHLLTPGNNSVLDWKPRAARRILSAWDNGTRVFVSERLVAEEPRPGWGWVEGDDLRVRWRDLHDFFSAFAYGGAARGGVAGDGFLALAPTPENRSLLEPYRVAATPASPGRCSMPAVIPAMASAGSTSGR